MFGFKYILMSPHFVPDEQVELFNKLFDCWDETFSKVLEDSGDKLDHDDFFRFDTIGMLMYNNEIVATQNFTQWDLRLKSSKAHHYIASLENSTVEKLVAEGRHKVFSFEYFFVAPEWRKRSQSLPFLEIMVGLGLKHVQETDAAGFIGTPRTDIKVDQMTIKLGAHYLQQPIHKMKYECAVVYFPRTIQLQYTHPEAKTWVQQLWKARSALNEKANTKNGRRAA